MSNNKEANQMFLNLACTELPQKLGYEFNVTDQNAMSFEKQEIIDDVVHTIYRSTDGTIIDYYFEVLDLGVEIGVFVVSSEVVAFDGKTDEDVLNICNQLNRMLEGYCTVYADDEIYDDTCVIIATNRICIKDCTDYEAAGELARQTALMTAGRIMRVRELYFAD